MGVDAFHHGDGSVAFLPVNIHIRNKNPCTLSHANTTITAHIFRAQPVAKPMNGVAHIKPILSRGLRAHGLELCFAMRINGFEQPASARTDVRKTK